MFAFFKALCSVPLNSINDTALFLQTSLSNFNSYKWKKIYFSICRPIPGANVMKLLYPWFMNFRNKLESLSISLSSLVSCLRVRMEPTLVNHPLGAPLYGRLRAYLQTLTKLEMLARDKHSSLLQKCVNYGQKMFFNRWPRCQCHETFFIPLRDWRQISWSVFSRLT
jgi:hypothetical protein